MGSMSEEVARILRRATINEHSLKLPPDKLERATYLAVENVLDRIGGTWRGGKTQAFLFSYDPSEILAFILDTGTLPEKNPLAFFPTPLEIVDLLFRMIWHPQEFDQDNIFAWREAPYRFLEPSAGQGAIVEQIVHRFPHATVDVVEIDPLNHAFLVRKFADNPRVRIILADILNCRIDDSQRYQYVLMNPPFSIDSDTTAYITHIQHVFDYLLQDGGFIAAIAAKGFTYRTDRKSSAFYNQVITYGGFELVPQGAFKTSGTLVETVLLWLHKEDQSWREKPYQGIASWHLWSALLYMRNDHDLLTAYDQLTENIASGKLPVNLLLEPAPETTEAIRTLWQKAITVGRKDQCGITFAESDWQEAFALTIADAMEYRELEQTHATR